MRNLETVCWRAMFAFIVLPLFVACAVPAAMAGPVAHVSRTAVDFSHVARNFATPVQPAYVTNTGDARLDVTQFSITGAQAGDFSLSGTCVAPMSLAPGESCRIDIVLKAPQHTYLVGATLSVHSNAPASPATIALAGYVDPNFTGVPFIVPTPAFVEFGDQPVGLAGSARTIALFNAVPPNPPFNLAISALQFIGGNTADFAVTSPCVRLYVGETCVISITFTPQDSGPRSTELVIDLQGTGPTAGASVSYRYSIAGFGAAGAATPPVAVVEYYNASLDHYFITWLPAEIAVLDAGTTIRGWERTTKTFKTFPAPQPSTTSVCRFYIPPDKGDSHFFGRGVTECTETGAKNPTFVLEDPAFMHMYLPTLGVCPASTTRVFRVFSNRPDTNHRYTTDPAVRDQMVAKGWLAEGDGEDLVVMCAP